MKPAAAGRVKSPNAHNMKNITYKKSGVDIAQASLFKQKIKSLVRPSFSKGVLADIGGFGSFFRFPKEEYRDPVLVSSADGVGTKLKIAGAAGRHDTVGIDAVAMNVNDILCTGARPCFFLDYIAFSELSSRIHLEIVKGITAGCVDAGCALIGGETAQMPGMYEPGEYDIAGFCVGAVERSNIIDGSGIRAGDSVIGLASNGIHSNGYSLVRKVFSENEQKRMARELLRPTRIYVKPVLDLIERQKAEGGRLKGPQKRRGISHITGGAFYDKISRILPSGVNARIDKESWPVPEIFKLIQSRGGVASEEMYHTLNMGIGMVLFVDASAADGVRAFFEARKIRAWKIGEAVKGTGKVHIV